MNIPDTFHYAIITSSTIYIPGDERSRTNPGHGYPEYTEEVISYEAIHNKEEFKKRCEVLLLRGTKFRALQVEPLSLSFEIKSMSKNQRKRTLDDT